MKTKTTYIANDGTVFEDEAKCLVRDASIEVARAAIQADINIEEADLVDAIEWLNKRYEFL